MAKTHTTAAVLIPPQEVWPPIQAIRERHDRQARRWMPHLTLIYPFRGTEEFEALLGPFSAACRSRLAFELRFQEIRHFRHGAASATLWLAPEPEEPLLELQAALQAIVPDCDEASRHEGGYTPHLSVGQFRGSRSGLLEFQGRLQAAWRPLSFEVREVCLIRRGQPPDDIFRVERAIPLGGRTSA